jgi:hypothetical protein
MSLFYIIFTHEVSAVPPDSPCINKDADHVSVIQVTK